MNIAKFQTNTNVRELPGTNSKVLKLAKAGDLAFVLSSGIVGGAYIWRKLLHYDGTIGYSAEQSGSTALFTMKDTSEDFNRAIDFTLKWEGGYVFNPQDPGGETNFGISKRSYPWLNIATLTEQHAMLIYYIDYWKDLDKYSWPKNCILFDIGVMTGVAHASTFRELDPAKILVMQYKYLANINSFPTFGRGWVRRTTDLLELTT